MDVSHPRINQKTAVQLLQDSFNKVVETQQPNIQAAADLIVRALGNDGVIQVFGTGHSRSFAMEIAGRAGGLVPASRLAISDLVFFGDTPPLDVLDPLLERDATLARRLLDVHDIHPADVFVICSNSGGNGSTVELARLVKERGHSVIAVTSMDHTQAIESRHPSGQKLYELADVVIDNGGVLGDATLQLPTGGAITATSTLTGSLIAQMLVTEICGLLLEQEQQVPVLLSANIPGGDEHNDELMGRYGNRIKTAAP